MSPDDRLHALVAEGHTLMARERSLLLRGKFDGLAELSADKLGLLNGLEDMIAQVRGTDSARTALAGLIADSQRNETIIHAARQGLSGARRRIDAIISAGRGAVAYDRDGSAITSRDDAARNSSRA